MKTVAVYDAQFMHNLGVIAQSEDLAKRLVKYVSRLAKPAADPTLMTREEIMAQLSLTKYKITFDDTFYVHMHPCIRSLPHTGHSSTGQSSSLVAPA